LNNYLRDELVRLANVYRNNTSVDVRNSRADQETKKLVEDVTRDTCDVLIAFANTIAETK